MAFGAFRRCRSLGGRRWRRDKTTARACSWRVDLRRVLNTFEPGPIVLVGTSLGAAVALQEAAEDRRVSAVVAAETFSDLRTVAVERAPFFFTPTMIRRAFQLAGQRGHFEIDAVSPAIAAGEIKVLVLLVHGEADTDSPWTIRGAYSPV
jgi:pimeloyl-ACP methyl ester carboxylesterase